MKLSIVFKDLERHAPAEKVIHRCAEKISKLLKSFDPDLVRLHCVFSRVPRTNEFGLSLNLHLANGTLHVSNQSEHLPEVCKIAFADLEIQAKKHVARLRKHHEFGRSRARGAREAEASA